MEWKSPKAMKENRTSPAPKLAKDPDNKRALGATRREENGLEPQIHLAQQKPGQACKIMGDFCC